MSSEFGGKRAVAKAATVVAFFGLLSLLSAPSAEAADAVTPPEARASGALDRGDPRVEAELVTDLQTAAPGRKLRVGVRFKLDPHWHIYWRNPGEAGLSSKLEYEAEGITFGPTAFPFPETFRTPDGFITTYGYADDVLLFSEAEVAPTAKGESVRIFAKVDVLACDVNCIPAKLRLSKVLPLGPTPVASPSDVSLFDAAAARVPTVDAAAHQNLQAVLHGPAPKSGESFVAELRVPGKGWKHGRRADAFVPDLNESLGELKVVTAKNGNARIEGTMPQTFAETNRLKGVLHLRSPDGAARFVEVDAPFEVTGKTAPGSLDAAVAGGAVSADDTEPPSAAWILLLAFLGGALLNLMPCVFPVLALKAYSFAKLAHEGRGAVASHALAYAAGVVGSLVLLALGVTVARWGGTQVGWGFQFQEPIFVALVSAVVVAFALNLFGVYYVGFEATGAVEKVEHTHGLRRSAGEGVLAVLLATPCSAPMLGTAVGFAFAGGTLLTFAVFIALGLGLAAPFCVLILVPGLAKKLPRPGEWMERLKQFLGFTLIGTAVWLLWVMGGLAGVEGMGRLAAFLAFVGLVTWLFGVSQEAPSSLRRWVIRAVAAFVLVVAGYALLDFPKLAEGSGGAMASSPSGHPAQPWSEAAVEAALNDGRPVFVDFTADWCLTCKVNERTVLSSDEVTKAFTRHNVALFVADWTRRDEPIRLKLAEHGRAGVPMYLVLSPKPGEAAVVLPELLTPSLVVEAITGAAPESTTQAAQKETVTP